MEDSGRTHPSVSGDLRRPDCKLLGTIDPPGVMKGTRGIGVLTNDHTQSHLLSNPSQLFSIRSGASLGSVAFSDLLARETRRPARCQEAAPSRAQGQSLHLS